MSFVLVPWRIGQVVAIGALTSSFAVGCAHSTSEKAQVDELNRTVAGLRIQNAAYSKQVEELENRVFILSDQVESRKVVAERVATPQLPTVTLHPKEQAKRSDDGAEVQDP